MICIRGQTLSGFPLIVPHSIYYFNGGAKLCHSFLNVRHSFAKEPIKKIGGKDHMVVVFVVTLIYLIIPIGHEGKERYTCQLRKNSARRNSGPNHTDSP